MERFEFRVEQIIALKLRQPSEDEYINNTDGLIYCKKCKTPRQCVLNINGNIKVLPTPCNCKQTALDIENKLKAEVESKAHVEWLRHTGITNEKYRNFTFISDDNRTPNLSNLLKNYVANFEQLKKKGQGLMLSGDKGTGKTFYAMCVANALIDKAYRVRAVTLSEVISLAQDFDNAELNFEELTKNDCIVVDDLGTERQTPFANEQIYKFINKCNVEDIPLVITTNYSPADFEKVITDNTDVVCSRIYSRVLEKCYPIKVNKIKRRAENQKRNNKEIESILLSVKPKQGDYYNGQEPYWCK